MHLTVSILSPIVSSSKSLTCMFLATAILLFGTAFAREPFPDWLHELTGLEDWPDENPPYIPMSHPGLDSLPEGPIYNRDQCSIVPESSCSYYCNTCLHPDDVATCPKLSQTFDDGPTPSTRRLLNGIKQPTTFFTLGRQVIKNPKIFRRELDEGHLVGSHSYNHVFLPSLNNEQVAAQLQWSIFAMNATGGIVPRFFRPPFGGTDQRIRGIAARLGLVTVLWSQDTDDWELEEGYSNTRQIFQRMEKFTKESHLSKGLLLEHDSSGKTVKSALMIQDLLNEQLTVADCVGTGIWYQENFTL